MPSNNGANYHLGDYYDVTGELYFNPLKASISDNIWTLSTNTFESDAGLNVNHIPGTFGEIKYYTNKEGPFLSTGTSFVESTFLLE